MKLKQIKKILVIRTDRIGEVLLTTPVITALKEAHPDAKVSMMVKAEVRALVEDNPNISEIIEYQGQGKGRGDPDSKSGPRQGGVPVGVQVTKLRSSRLLWLQAFRFANFLKAKRFDAVIIVNPKKEFHLAAFLAGIPIRVGFDRKWGFLLTHRVKDLKFEAKKHEVEYNLDLVRALGIEPSDKRPVLLVREKGQFSPELDFLNKPTRPLVALHPCTSNPLKMWPKEHFARLGDLLFENGYNIAVVSGAEEMKSARETIGRMKHKPIDLAGKLPLKRFAQFLTGCRFLVSSDSGPVHIAAAVGTRVVALFGGQDPGSRPLRWAPYGEGHIVIARENIADITPEEVVRAIIGVGPRV